MTEEVIDAEETGQQEVLSVGASLRAARERCGYELRDIAQALKLDILVITALENNDFEHLPEPIFVCGYLRAYANHVSIPSDPLIEAFTNRGIEAPPITRQKPVKAQVSSRDNHVRGVSYGLALVLLIMLITWWRSNSLDITDTAPVPVAEKETVITPVQVTTELETTPDSMSDDPVTTQANIQPLPDEQVETVVEPQVSVSAASDETPPVITETVVDKPAGPQSSIVMVFSADSWLEVEDAAGNKLEYNLMREGRKHELSGIAPFKVFLGNAREVEIEYNGRPFDHTPYIKGDLAHFRLGRSGDTVTADETETE